MPTDGCPGIPSLDRVRDSPTLERAVRHLDALLHHRIPSIGRSGCSGEHVDNRSVHDGLDAPPWFLRNAPSLLGSRLEEDAFANPVLTATDVTDYGDVNYVADPFLILDPVRWCLYFEVFNPDRDPTAVVGRATSHDCGQSWEYDGIVLNPGVHVSFPYVFRHDGSVYMTPNLDPDDDTGVVTLYRADGANGTFREHLKLADPPGRPTDRVVFHHGERWWLFVAVAAADVELHVYHSDSLTKPSWTPHDGNPVTVDEPRIPGGRPIVINDRVITFVQDGDNYYGECVRAVEITRLSPTVYEDRSFRNEQIVAPADSALGWNTGRMHTFDPWYTGDRWVCAVDGDTGLGSSLVGPHWSIGLYVAPG